MGAVESKLSPLQKGVGILCRYWDARPPQNMYTWCLQYVLCETKSLTIWILGFSKSHLLAWMLVTFMGLDCIKESEIVCLMRNMFEYQWILKGNSWPSEPYMFWSNCCISWISRIVFVYEIWEILFRTAGIRQWEEKISRFCWLEEWNAFLEEWLIRGNREKIIDSALLNPWRRTSLPWPVLLLVFFWKRFNLRTTCSIQDGMFVSTS